MTGGGGNGGPRRRARGEHSGQTAARTLDPSDVLCPEPRGAEGPLLPCRRPSNMGRSEVAPAPGAEPEGIQSAGEGGRAGRPRQERASPPHGSSAKRWRHTWGGDALRTRWTEMDVTEAALPASSQLNGRRNTHFQTIKLQSTGQCCADFPQCMLGKPHVLSGRVLGAGEQRLCPYLRL